MPDIPENTEVTTTKRKSKPSRKRKMSESLESNDRKSYFENKLIPPRSEKVGRRVLVSNCTVYFHNSFFKICLLYTSPSPRDRQKSRMPSSA